MAKIAVLGADGFIGRHLVDELAKDSSNEIRAFDRFPSYKIGDGHPFEGFSGVEIVPGDFFNREDVSSLLDGVDYVFHLISLTNPATSNNDPFIDIDGNIRTSVELFTLCAEHKVKKVIFLSSGGTVYGDVDSDAIPEEALPSPRSPYGIGKLAIEHYLRYFKLRFGLNYVVYRVSNPYGPGQNIHGKQGVIPIFMKRILDGDPVTVFGDGSMVRDYIYVTDLVHLLASTYKKNNKCDEYNLGSGSGSTVNQLIGALEKCAPIGSIKIERVPTPPTYIEKSVLDISRFKKEFKLAPSTCLEDGLQQTWEYVKEVSYAKELK